MWYLLPQKNPKGPNSFNILKINYQKSNTTLNTGSEIPNAAPLYVPVLTGLQISDEKILGVIC